MRTIGAAVALVVGAFILLYNSHFTIDDEQQAVITQFGKVVKAYTDPGEYYKIPFVQEVHYLPALPFESNISAEITTIDKKFLKVETIIHCKIFDPISVYQNLYDKYLADIRLDDIVGIAERNVIIIYKLDEIVFYANEPKLFRIRCHPKIEDEIVQILKPKLKEFGIELINIEALITYPI